MKRRLLILCLLLIVLFIFLVSYSISTGWHIERIYEVATFVSDKETSEYSMQVFVSGRIKFNPLILQPLSFEGNVCIPDLYNGSLLVVFFQNETGIISSLEDQELPVNHTFFWDCCGKQMIITKGKALGDGTLYTIGMKSNVRREIQTLISKKIARIRTADS